MSTSRHPFRLVGPHDPATVAGIDSAVSPSSRLDRTRAPGRPAVVQKFGGTSLADPDLLRAAAGRIAATWADGIPVAVVVSAMGHETDQLLAAAGSVGSARSGRELDMLICSGEQKAAALMSLALRDLGVPADAFTGAQAGIRTNAAHTQASILAVSPERVEQALQAGRVPVVCGAQGVTSEGDTTFLGRGGSDTSAVALAAALRARVCELYTDVRGIYTADPKSVPGARRLLGVGYDEMVAMCAAGCPKPATRAVELARRRHVALHVRSAQEATEGTWIASDRSIGQTCLAVVSGPAERGDGPAAAAGSDRVEVSLVGRPVDARPELAWSFWAIIEASGIEAIGAGTGKLRCSVTVDAAEAGRTVRAIHDGLALAGTPSFPAQITAEPFAGVPAPSVITRDRPDRVLALAGAAADGDGRSSDHGC